MAKRVASMSDLRDKFNGSFGNVQYETLEEKVKPWQKNKKEFKPIKTEKEFKQQKLNDKLEKKQIDSLDARDLLLFYKNKVESVGNVCPIVLHGKSHNLMKTLIQKYGSYTVYSVIKFLFEADHPLIQKRVISLYYINKNIDWLQAYGDLYLRGEDFSPLLVLCKPVNRKEYDKNVGNIVGRESDFSNFTPDAEGW